MEMDGSDELYNEYVDELVEDEEDEQNAVPVWVKALVLVVAAVVAVLVVLLLLGQRTPASSIAAVSTDSAAPAASSTLSLCGTARDGGGGSSSSVQSDSEGCDKVVKYDLVRKRCPLGWRPKRRQDGGSMCCVYAPEMFSQRDEAVRGSKAFVISVNITAGVATELVLPWAMKKALSRIAAKGVKLGTRLINKMMLSGSRVLIRIATAAAKMATKAAIAGAQIAAKAAAGPPGWVLIVFQLLTLLLDFWDPMNYNAFEANRIFIAARNIIITGFHSAMAQASMEPPFIFPLVMAYPKEFEAAYSDVILRATSNYLLTLCDEEQTLFWSSMFTGEDELSERERQVLARINRDMEAAASNMNPRVRDSEIYKRMCLLVGAENLWLDDSLSTPTRMAVSVSAEWARRYNERARILHETETDNNNGNRFLPMIVFTDSWYVPDGSMTVEVVLSLGNVNQWIGAAAGLMSEAAGEAIAPVSTVPKMRKVRNPSGRAIPQYNLMGAFKYNTCMGKRNCEKIILSRPLCQATVERDLRYSDYGVNFDDDKLICQYTCRLCERFGLRFTDFDDPTISNVPNATITDCEMYPGQDIMELILGTTLTRDMYRRYQSIVRMGQAVVNFAINVYNEMCTTLRPGEGGICPLNCDRPQDCTPEACVAACKNNVVTRTVCEVSEDICCASFALKWMCLLDLCDPICREVTEYVLDQGCHAACEANCALMRIPGYCETWQGVCGVVGELCDWTGEITPLDQECPVLSH
jgi:hypothetical protein